MRRSRLLRGSGPYRVVSYSQNSDGQVYAVVHPAYPRYGSDWAEARAQGKGGAGLRHPAVAQGALRGKGAQVLGWPTGPTSW